MTEKRYTEYIVEGIIEGMKDEKQTRPDIALLKQRLYELSAVEKGRFNAEINADNAEIKRDRRQKCD